MGISKNVVLVDIFIPFWNKYTRLNLLHIVLMFLVYSIQTLLIPRCVTRIGELTMGYDKNNKELLRQEIKWLIGYIVSFIVISFLENIVDSFLHVRQFSMIRRTLYDKMLLFLETNFRSVRIGEFITIMSYLPREIRHLSNCLSYVFPGLFSYVILVGYFLWMEWRTGLILMLGLVGTLWLMFSSPLSRQLIQDCRIRTEQQLETNSGVAEDIVQLDQIIGTNRISSKLVENTGREDSLQRDFFKSYNTSCIIYTVLQIWNILILFLAGFVLYRYKTKETRGHALRTYIVVMSSFMGVLWTFIYKSTQFVMASSTTDVYYQHYLDMVGKTQGLQFAETTTSYQTSSISTQWTEIRWENVSFQYNESSSMVLSNINWTIPTRSRWVLQGPSGRGKSTLLKLLMRFHAPSQGSIFIDGQPIETFEVRQLRNHIIYINQDTTLFNQTILQNICMDNKDITPEYVSNALTKFNLLSILAEDKNSPQLDAEAILNRSCGVDGKNLSKGQQKIISLFRSLVALPSSTQILLLDEPLASLDAESRRGVLLMIGDILEQRPEITLIMTTHVMDDHRWFQQHRFQSYQPWV